MRPRVVVVRLDGAGDVLLVTDRPGASTRAAGTATGATRTMSGRGA
ncbi:MAG: hypothetical protein AB7J32_22250 [Pseudonocardia sp.]